MKFGLAIFILIFTLFSNAERREPAAAFLSNAQNQLAARTPSGSACELGKSCPQFLQSLQKEDYESRFAGLGFLESRAPVCQTPVTQSRSPDIVSRFANAEALQQQLARTYPEIGPLNTNTAKACATATDNDASARYRVAKFYMYSKRLNDGATRAVEEIAAINSLLGEKNAAECHGRGSVNQAFRRCQALNNCPSGESQLAATAAVSARDEEYYKDVKEQLTQLERCLSREKDYTKYAGSVTAANPTRHYCEQVFVERQAPQQFCYDYTWAEKQKMSQCKLAVTNLQIIQGALEDKNPWFRSENYFELRKTKNVTESIRLQVLSNRRELAKKFNEFEAAALCLNGASNASACDTDQVRTVLAGTPEIPEQFSRDRQENAATLYLGAQSCIEEAVRDQTETARTLRGLAGDAVLTVATAGLSGYAIAARSAVAVNRGARVAFISALAIDGFYVSQSFAAAAKACAPQVEKIQVAMRADPLTQCPGPQSNQAQAQKEYSNCAMSAAFAALDTLPLVPLIPKIKRAVVARTSAATSGVQATASAAEAPVPVESLRRLASEDVRNLRDVSSGTTQPLDPRIREQLILNQRKENQSFTFFNQARISPEELRPSHSMTTPLVPIGGRIRTNPGEISLINDPIIANDPLNSGGINDGKRLLKFKSGASGVWKPHEVAWYSNYRAEVLAYEVDQKLGFNLVPPTVEANIGGKVGSIQLFVRSDSGAVPLASEIDKQHALDFLIDNGDRHSGNYLVDSNGKVISIDNGIAFTGNGNNSIAFADRVPHLKRFVKTPEGKAVVSRVRESVNDPKFIKQLGDYLGPEDAQKMLKRMRYFISFAEKFG